MLSKFEILDYIHVFVPGAYSSSSGNGSSGSFGSSHTATFPAPVLAGTCFDMPRFGLKFLLQQTGQVASEDFQNYVLSENQQLASHSSSSAAAVAAAANKALTVQYTLPGFSQYLVLQHTPTTGSNSSKAPVPGGDSTLVLVPVGDVERTSSGLAGQGQESIRVRVDQRSGANIMVSCLFLSGPLYMLFNSRQCLPA